MSVGHDDTDIARQNRINSLLTKLTHCLYIESDIVLNINTIFQY